MRKVMLIPPGDRVLMVKVKELREEPVMLRDLGTRSTILIMDLEDLQGETTLLWNHLLMEPMLATPLVDLSMNTLKGSSHFIVNH